MIESIQILGERCSGTNFIASLVENNFARVRLSKEFGGKHWFLKNHHPRSRPNETTDAQCIRSVHEDTSDTLFLCIVRNPYDWSRSIHARPYHAHNHADISFSQFLRKPWLSYEKSRINRFWKPAGGNFWFIEEAPNVLRLRSMKLAHWLNLEGIVENIAFLKYEDVQQDITTLANVARRFDIALRHPSFEGESRYMGRAPGTVYTPREYPAIFEADLEFIQQELDWVQENRVGYSTSDYHG